MSIDIETLSYEELLELRHMIDRRLDHLDSLAPPGPRQHLQPGDTVSFSHPRQGELTGTLLRRNGKTATIVTSSGQQWDVAAHLLRRDASTRQGKGKKAAVIPLRSNSR